jgi:hypothetical protein
MGLNRAFDRPFFIMNGAVKQTGGSLNLAKGQLALVDSSQTSANGLAVVTSAAGKPKDKKDFQLRVGVVDKDPTRSYSNKDQSTMPFSLNEIVDLKVDAPQITEHRVDEVIVGYDGVNDNTAFNFQTGDAYFRLSLEMKGGAVAFRGGKGDTEMVNINVEIPECDPFNNCEECDECAAVDCRQITLEAIERIKEKQLTGGQKVGDLIDVTPVFGCDTPANLTEVPWNYYCLEICDTGTDEALALVQAQYDTVVIRTNRVGSTSSYQVLLPNTAGDPADFDQTLASYINGCEDCPPGWTESPEGFLYAFTMEDNGVDESATLVTDLNAVVGGIVIGGTVQKSGNDNGVGYYTILLNAELTQAQIDSYIATSALTATATVELIGDVDSVCTNPTVTSTAWTQCGTCNVITEDYTIVIPDNECGEPILDVIQGNYDSPVTIAQTDGTTLEFTLAGSSGGGEFDINGQIYQIPFVAPDVDATGNAFVAAEANNILVNHNISVVYNPATDILTFTAPNYSWVAPVYTQTSGDLTATAGAETPLQVDDRVNCQTRYQTSVVSNIVCEECSIIFRDYYITEAPEPFDLYEWEASDANPEVHPTGNCRCGIRFKSKVFVIDMEECLRDLTGFVETSTQLRVAAGYPEEIREGIGRLPEGTYPVKYLERWQPRTHLAGNLRDLENEARAYFRGGTAYRKDYLGRLIRGETTNMEDQVRQYVQYTLTVRHTNFTQSFAGRINETINYDFYVEVGRHNAVETLLNNLAGAAGVAGVQAFGA